MSRIALTTATLALLLLQATTARAFLGTELGPLMQLVAGQVQELERLAQNVGLAQDQLQLLHDLNQGIDKTVAQIQTLHQIIDRTQGLNTSSVKSIADLNELLERAKGTKDLIDDLLFVKLRIADQAIDRSSVQSETAYRMGQEMVLTGSQLAAESRDASPGRSAQISAASSSAQMLSQGVQLQTLAQVTELQALMLEFQKSALQKQLIEERARRAQVVRQLSIRPRRKRS